MALPYATNQLIRYITDRVIENVARQVARPAPQPDPAALAAAPSDLVAVIGVLNSNMIHLQRQLAALEAELERLDRRMTRLEKRWSWTVLARVVGAVAVAFVLGLIAWQMFVWGGWLR